MNFYREWKRFYIEVYRFSDRFRFACGRWPQARYAIDEPPAIPDDPEAHGIVHVGAQTATVTAEPLNPVSQTTGD